MFKIKKGIQNHYYYNNKRILSVVDIKYNCIQCNISVNRKEQVTHLNNNMLCSICKIKQTKLERYGDENYNNIDKAKQTNLKKYGNKNYRNIKKNKQTKLERYGDENYNNIDKAKQTNLKKYGVEFGLQSEIVKRKSKISYLKKYGDENIFKTNYFKNKVEKIMNNKYGGTGMGSKKIKKKIIKTMNKLYGVDNAMQVPLFHDKATKTLKKNDIINENLHYQSILELNYINECKNNNIDIWDGPSIPYYFDGKKHIYHIDFETNKEIVEIKGNHHWYKEDLKSGKIEAKNRAAKKYCSEIGKDFKFILDGEEI